MAPELSTIDWLKQMATYAINHEPEQWEPDGVTVVITKERAKGILEIVGAVELDAGYVEYSDEEITEALGVRRCRHGIWEDQMGGHWCEDFFAWGLKKNE